MERKIFPVDKWEFLTAVANSEQASKSWKYDAAATKDFFRILLDFSHSEFCISELSKAITFALVFQGQFMSLDAEGQKAVLQVLSRVDRNF